MFQECVHALVAHALVAHALVVECKYVHAVGACFDWGEPHTSGTALRMCVCMFACLLAAIYRKFLNERG